MYKPTAVRTGMPESLPALTPNRYGRELSNTVSQCSVKWLLLWNRNAAAPTDFEAWQCLVTSIQAVYVKKVPLPAESIPSLGYTGLQHQYIDGCPFVVLTLKTMIKCGRGAFEVRGRC